MKLEDGSTKNNHFSWFYCLHFVTYVEIQKYFFLKKVSVSICSIMIYAQ